MKANTLIALVVSACFSNLAFAGVIDPDCTMKDGVKRAATKATVGVGGRCTPEETLSDSKEKAIDNTIPDDGAIDKVRDTDKSKEDHKLRD